MLSWPELKQLVQKHEKAVKDAKERYKTALKNLEVISNEVCCPVLISLSLFLPHASLLKQTNTTQIHQEREKRKAALSPGSSAAEAESEERLRKVCVGGRHSEQSAQSLNNVFCPPFPHLHRKSRQPTSASGSLPRPRPKRPRKRRWTKCSRSWLVSEKDLLCPLAKDAACAAATHVRRLKHQPPHHTNHAGACARRRLDERGRERQRGRRRG